MNDPSPPDVDDEGAKARALLDSGTVSGLPRVPPGKSAESTIRRDRFGRWYHDGQPVAHEGVQKCFDAWIERHENGRYVLRNSVNWAFVVIDGAPIIVKRVRVAPDGLWLGLSDGREELLQAPTLRQDPEGILYCQVRQGRLTAQFSRQAVFDLEPFVDEDDEGITVAVGQDRVRPVVTESPIR